MTLLITLLILIALAIFMPTINNAYKESMWRYVKEKIEFEKRSEDLRKKFERK